MAPQIAGKSGITVLCPQGLVYPSEGGVAEWDQKGPQYVVTRSRHINHHIQGLLLTFIRSTEEAYE